MEEINKSNHTVIKAKEPQGNSRAPWQRRNSAREIKRPLRSDDLTKLGQPPGSRSQGRDLGAGRGSSVPGRGNCAEAWRWEGAWHR